MHDAPPLLLLLAAAPDAPGARAVVARAREAAGAGRPVRILLTGAGLAWAGESELAAHAEDGRADVALCSRSARERGLSTDDLPSWIRWSSLVAWLRAPDPGAALWGVFP